MAPLTLLLGEEINIPKAKPIITYVSILLNLIKNVGPIFIQAIEKSNLFLVNAFLGQEVTGKLSIALAAKEEAINLALSKNNFEIIKLIIARC